MDASTALWESLRDTLDAQSLSAEALRGLQAERLGKVVRTAAAHVPLYRDLFARHGVRADDVRGPDDLWRLPAVSKDDYLRVGPEGCLDAREDRALLVLGTTSGSLGRTLNFYVTREENLRRRAALWSAWLGRGVGPEDRLLMMAAPYLSVPLGSACCDFIPVQMPAEEALRRFRALRPTALIGSVEAIALLARDALRLDLPERRGVRRVFPFGQTLSSHLERMIRSGFDAPLFNLYGAAETVWMGCGCAGGDGLHVPLDRVIVQIARLNRPDVPAEPGELGEVIVTSLMQATTPFIRYRIKDVAALDDTPCPCGLSTPRLRRLEGRVQDFLISTTGAWVSPGAVATDLAHHQAAIADHRIVQESRGRVRVSIVPDGEFSTSDRDRVAEVLRRHLGDVEVAVDLIAEIPRDPSGKRRRVYRAFELEAS